MPLLECVPNVSEGRDSRRIERLSRALEAGGARLLDRSSDPDHHRTVFTLAGEPEPLHRSLLALYECAIEEIDLRAHAGVHPRLGAVDVAPFVALGDTPPVVARQAALRLASEVAQRFDIPVFLYGEVARRPDRENLADLRRGGLTAWQERFRDPGEAPDFGPTRLHPTAGATVVGARFFLVAFNAVLDTADVRVARRVARAVRASSGGPPALKALGLELSSPPRAQVSMNLTDYRQTALPDALAAVERAAARQGARVVETEIVGLTPRAATGGKSASQLKLPGPLPLLEDRLGS